MISKQYLFDHKDANHFVSVCIKEPTSAGLTALYERLFSILNPEININDIFIVEYQGESHGFLKVVLDVEDMDFSEFED